MAFITHRGIFLYNVILFCFCNGPATFQRMMKRVISDRIGIDVLCTLSTLSCSPYTQRNSSV